MNSPTIPCISLWQPFASLCLITLDGLAPKGIETRPWGTNYRGPLAIHAAKRCNKRELTHFVGCRWDFCAALSPLGVRMGDKKALWDVLPFGALLGVVNVVDCRPVESFTVAELDVRRFAQCDIEGKTAWFSERGFGDYTPGKGRFGWVFEKPRALPEPVPYRGQQRFFNVPTSLLNVPL